MDRTELDWYNKAKLFNENKEKCLFNHIIEKFFPNVHFKFASHATNPPSLDGTFYNRDDFGKLMGSLNNQVSRNRSDNLSKSHQVRMGCYSCLNKLEKISRLPQDEVTVENFTDYSLSSATNLNTVLTDLRIDTIPSTRFKIRTYFCSWYSKPSHLCQYDLNYKIVDNNAKNKTFGYENYTYPFFYPFGEFPIDFLCTVDKLPSGINNKADYTTALGIIFISGALYYFYQLLSLLQTRKMFGTIIFSSLDFDIVMYSQLYKLIMNDLIPVLHKLTILNIDIDYKLLQELLLSEIDNLKNLDLSEMFATTFEQANTVFSNLVLLNDIDYGKKENARALYKLLLYHAKYNEDKAREDESFFTKFISFVNKQRVALVMNKPNVDVYFNLTLRLESLIKKYPNIAYFTIMYCLQKNVTADDFTKSIKYKYIYPQKIDHFVKFMLRKPDIDDMKENSSSEHLLEIMTNKLKSDTTVTVPDEIVNKHCNCKESEKEDYILQLKAYGMQANVKVINESHVKNYVKYMPGFIAKVNDFLRHHGKNLGIGLAVGAIGYLGYKWFTKKSSKRKKKNKSSKNKKRSSKKDPTESSSKKDDMENKNLLNDNN